MDKESIKILVVDDEEDLCEILKFNLESEGYHVDTTNSAEEALLLNIETYSLLLLDVMMGEISGFKMAKMLKANPKTALIPVIFITAKDTENDTITGLTIGADDYISKPFSLREVCLRVNAVLRRSIENKHKTKENSNNTSISFQGMTLNLSKKILSIDEETISLTKTELEILELLITNRGRLFSRADIIDRIWHDNAVVTDRTVDVNITRLRKKIGKYGSCITTRQGYGYCFEE